MAQVEIRLKALEETQQADILFQTAKSLLTDWQTLLTNLTNEDTIYWQNVDANCFVCKYGDIRFGIEEWPEGRVVYIGETAILSYDRKDYGSDKLLSAIYNQQKRKAEPQSSKKYKKIIAPGLSSITEYYNSRGYRT